MIALPRRILSRRAAIACSALLLAACSSDGPPLGPDLSPQFNDGTTPPWTLYVCKNAAVGSTAYFNVTATSGTVKHANPLAVVVGATSPSCVLAWEGAAGTPVSVTVTELATPGMEFLAVTVNRDAPGATIDGMTVTITEQYFADEKVGGVAVLTFRNRNVEVPNLTAVKTAAGSYEVPVTWQLVKSVNPTSHTGEAGQIAGSSTWSVTATRVEGAATNHLVTGTITVSNPIDGMTRTFTVADVVGGVSATVNCPTNTLAPGESTVCTYSAAVAGATTNTATVSTAGSPDITATAAVAYTGSFTGDETVTLADPRFGYSQSISSTTTVTFPETFPCPSDAAQYTNGTHNRTETNTATLTGANTNLSATADVNITCTMRQGNGETATGQGFKWSATQGAPNNWFMYTPWVTTSGHRGISTAASGSTPAGTNLIAGQHHIAGRITGTRGSGSNSTSITITLNSDWGFFAEGGNVKINPMSCTTNQPYVSPGQFAVHRTASAGATSITVTGLPNTACYGIHVDVVER